jgi:serine-type D-Ala-D-Ala carboxypeptidase (penicillin-binding protein 5/6)
MEELKQLLEKNNLSRSLKVFGISMSAGFLMVILPSLGINKILPNFYSVAQIANPMPAVVDPLENIYPKLQSKVNNYSLYKPTEVVPAAAAVENDYEQSNAYAVVDFDSGKVISSKNLSEQVSIASLTKVMTAVVALDLAKPSDVFTVSQKASDIIPTKIGVVEGQKMTLEELLNAAILTSANDAVQVIREGVDTQYNNEIFIKSMNAKAKILGLKNTHFENPQGFDGEAHYSTAEDLSILTHYAMANYPLIAEMAKKEYAFLEASESHKQFDLYNWNGLLGVYPNAQGVKIGSTAKAQKTTIVMAEREGKKVMAVLLGAPGTLERDLWASQLLDLGFEKEYGLMPVNITEEQLREKYSTWKYFE